MAPLSVLYSITSSLIHSSANKFLLFKFIQIFHHHVAIKFILSAFQTILINSLLCKVHSSQTFRFILSTALYAKEMFHSRIESILNSRNIHFSLIVVVTLLSFHHGHILKLKFISQLVKFNKFLLKLL